MNYNDWLSYIPAEFKNDPLWQMKVYRLSVLIGDLAWHDVSQLIQDQRMIGLSDQLYRAVGSVGANIAEGYSRRSGKDQARFYEYALGSAREARTWYHHGRHNLPESVVSHRLGLLTDVIRLLLTIIPSERGFKMAEQTASYDVGDFLPDDDFPMP